MKILILGGTVFVGRWLVTFALEEGHEVTLFNRGHSNPDLFPNVEQVHGDRNEGFNALAGRHFDAIIDTCAYFPRQVELAATFFRDRIATYHLVSSVSVYSDSEQLGMCENAPVLEEGDANATEVTAENYGALKVLCERRLREYWNGPVQITRPGLICGPWDPTGRFSYWLRRIHEGGQVLAPGEKDNPVQFIDVRDLSLFMLNRLKSGKEMLCHAVGPKQQTSFEEFLICCRRVSESNAILHWAPEDLLKEQQISAYHEMPLWVPESAQGFNHVDASHARELGLTFRTMRETIEDTLNWSLERSADFPRGDDPRRPGIGPKREEQILKALQLSNG